MHGILCSKGKARLRLLTLRKKLVVEGLYKFVRNPMYIGILLILLGHVLWFRSVLLILYAVSIFAVFHLFVIFYEEPHLKKRFGDSYNQYLHRVPKWIPSGLR